MGLASDPFLLAILVVLGVVSIAYLAIVNKSLFGFESSSDSEYYSDFETVVENPLGDIFYLYNHKSEKDWMKWIDTQSRDVKTEAHKLLSEHLGGPSKFWGYVTLEVLGVMSAFKDFNAQEDLGKFLQENGRLWGEYKSIPNYYEKAIHVLIDMDPLYAMRTLNDELESNSSGSQASHDKKIIIVNALPKLEELGIGMMIALLNNSDESFTIKIHALRVAESFSGEGFRQIVLESLKKQVKRMILGNRDVKSEDSQLLQDLLKEGIRNIGQYDFFNIIREACSSPKLQHYIINPLVKRLNEEKTALNPSEVYAMTLLRDNEQNDLRRGICRLHGLEASEINNICIVPMVQSFSEDDLKYQNIKENRIYVPSIFKNQYDDFKALFFQSGNKTGEECEKSYGGILITGDDLTEKLYFSKSFAKEKNFNFGYIDIGQIINKESYNSVCSIFSNLRKPYILFIDNPELMFPSDKSDTATYREKFSQTLYIQALDSKSMLVGSINKSLEGLNDENILYAIGKLRKKFFAQLMELNKREERLKPNIVEEYLKSISTHRFDDRANLVHELVELGKEQSFMEFTFFTIDTLATMLMVYGKDMPYSEIKKLQNKFSSDRNNRNSGTNDEVQDYQLEEDEEFIEEKLAEETPDLALELETEPLAETN